MSTAVNGMKVAGLAFNGTKIAGLCKAGEVFWRLVEKVKSEWVDQTDKLFAVANNKASGMTITKNASGDYLLTVTTAIADGSILIGADSIPNLGNLCADWPEAGTIRVTLEQSDIRVNLGGFGLSSDGSSFQVETSTKSSDSAWFGLWARQTVQPGTYRFPIRFETKPS